MENSNLTQLKAFYTQKYGVEMDNWTAILFMEIQLKFNQFGKHNEEAFNKNNNAIEANLIELNELKSQIKGQINKVEFANNKQAFLYGFGKNLLFGISSIIAVISLLSFYISTQDYKDKTEFVSRYPSVEKFETIYRNGQIIDFKGYKSLVVQPFSESNKIMGKFFIYDAPNKRVILPISEN